MTPDDAPDHAVTIKPEDLAPAAFRATHVNFDDLLCLPPDSVEFDAKASSARQRPDGSWDVNWAFKIRAAALAAQADYEAYLRAVDLSTPLAEVEAIVNMYRLPSEKLAPPKSPPSE